MGMTHRDRRAEMMRRGLTVTQMAEELGLSVSHVSNALRDKPRYRSQRVQNHFAKRIGKTVRYCFPTDSNGMPAA